MYAVYAVYAVCAVYAVYPLFRATRGQGLALGRDQNSSIRDDQKIGFKPKCPYGPACRGRLDDNLQSFSPQLRSYPRVEHTHPKSTLAPRALDHSETPRALSPRELSHVESSLAPRAHPRARLPESSLTPKARSPRERSHPESSPESSPTLVERSHPERTLSPESSLTMGTLGTGVSAPSLRLPAVHHHP